MRCADRYHGQNETMYSRDETMDFEIAEFFVMVVGQEYTTFREEDRRQNNSFNNKANTLGVRRVAE